VTHRIGPGELELRVATRHQIEAAIEGPWRLAAAIHGSTLIADDWERFPEALGPTLEALADKPDGDPWGSHFFLLREPPTLVGWGGFKGPPVAGSVEVGYAVAPEYEGRGIATAAVALLLAKAAASGEVEVVTAHTLAEPNASTKVLEHAGFERDPELALEGEREVWEWRRPLSPPAPGPEQS